VLRQLAVELIQIALESKLSPLFISYRRPTLDCSAEITIQDPIYENSVSWAIFFVEAHDGQKGKK